MAKAPHRQDAVFLRILQSSLVADASISALEGGVFTSRASDRTIAAGVVVGQPYHLAGCDTRGAHIKHGAVFSRCVGDRGFDYWCCNPRHPDSPHCVAAGRID